MIIQSVLFFLFLIVYGFHSIRFSDVKDALLCRKTIRIKHLDQWNHLEVNHNIIVIQFIY